jgi:hypothetical protein
VALTADHAPTANAAGPKALIQVSLPYPSRGEKNSACANLFCKSQPKSLYQQSQGTKRQPISLPSIALQNIFDGLY